jgi:proteasome lid subunit RPN8/RPN11
VALELPAVVLEEIRAHGREAYPNECCGLLVGRLGTPPRVSRSRRMHNLNLTRPWDRYEMDPAELLRATREADAEGLTVVGCYHSHPDHPALPSATDAALACPDFSYLIVAVRGGVPAEARSWLFAEPVADRYVALREAAGEAETPGVVGTWVSEYVLWSPTRRGSAEPRVAVRESTGRVVTEEKVIVV